VIEFFRLTDQEHDDMTFEQLRVYERWMASALKAGHG
jgi:hypothetical protein